MSRLLRALALAGFEATLVSLPLLALSGIAAPWPLLLAVVGLGWLADQVARRLPPAAERPALIAGALGAADLLISALLGRGPLVALAALLPGGPQAGQAYLLLLLALYLYWRGTRVDSRDSGAVVSLFGRGAAASILALLLGAIFRPEAAVAAERLAAHVLGLVGLGLLALALAHSEEEGALGRRLSWPWLLTIALAIAGVILAGSLAAALLGGGAGLALAEGLIRVILLPFALLGAGLAWLFYSLVGAPLAALLRAILDRFPQIDPPDLPQDNPADFYGQDPGAFITGLAVSATWLMALIPLVILLAAILLVRRRTRPRARPDEERESLGVAASLASDLRALMARLGNPFARPLTGLRAALAALGGGDPTTRARRAYVRLLLSLERRERARPPAQTPAEFAPAAAAATGAAQPVADLTAAYERARYDPAGAGPDDAARAEAALEAIDRGDAGSRRA